MKYTVVLKPSAVQDLAAVWLSATDRTSVTSASNLIDSILGNDPAQVGVISFDTVRILIVEPLGVEFEVIEADRMVHILAVWSTQD